MLLPPPPRQMREIDSATAAFQQRLNALWEEVGAAGRVAQGPSH